MGASSTTAVPNASQEVRSDLRTPWYLWCGVAAVTSAAVGGAWDVSWHRSIGRDSFWTPAHMAIYACGVLAAVVCGYLVFIASFRAPDLADATSARLRAISVNVFGLHAPFGAFLAGWGCLAMLTAAPFDNWWHSAYGLDVTIVSPPHTLLILGIRAVDVGILFLFLAEMNRAAAMEGATFVRLQRLFLYLAGLIVSGMMFFLMEYTEEINLHSVLPYLAMAIALPLVLAALAEASRHRWAATIAASIYMLFVIGQILILPLFPAEPRLGPVYHPVSHMVPARFPVLLVFPAVALDLLWQQARPAKRLLGRPWVLAVATGVIFVAILAAVEWPFADFLMSKWSENRFFGTMYFGFNAHPGSFEVTRQFAIVSRGWTLWLGLTVAAAIAAIETWLGLHLGRWMRAVQR